MTRTGVIVDFLKDEAKIVFGSAVLGFFIPGLAGEVTVAMFVGGIVATIVLLTLAVTLIKQEKKT